MALEFDFAMHFARDALEWHWPGQETKWPPKYMVDDGSPSRYLPIVHSIRALLIQLERDLRQLGVTQPTVALGAVVDQQLDSALLNATGIDYFVLVYHLQNEVEYTSGIRRALNRPRTFDAETMVPHPASVWVIDRERGYLYNYYYGRWQFPDGALLRQFLRDFYARFRRGPQVRATLFPLDSRATFPEKLTHEPGIAPFIRCFNCEKVSYVLRDQAPDLEKIWAQHGFEAFEEAGANATCKVFARKFVDDDFALAERLFAAFRAGRASVNEILNPARIRVRLHQFVDPARYNWVPTREEPLESDAHKGFVAQLVPKGNPARSHFIIGGYRSVFTPAYWIYDHRIGYLDANLNGGVFAMFTGLRDALIKYRYYNDRRLTAHGCIVRLWTLTGIPT